MGGAIGLMMSDGSSGFPFTRMKPPGAAAAVNPLAEGMILQERLCRSSKRNDSSLRGSRRERVAIFAMKIELPDHRLAVGVGECSQ